MSYSIIIRTLKILSITSFGYILSSCLANPVSEQNNPLRDNNNTKVSLVSVKTLDIKSTLIITGTNSHRGLLGYAITAMLSSSTNTKIESQEKLILPVRKIFLQYNYGSKFRAAVQDNIGDIDWLNNSYIDKYPGLQKNNIEELLRKNKNDDNVFIIDSSYSFSPDYNSINVICHASMHYRNKSKLINKTDGSSDYLIYQNKFNYNHTLPSNIQEQKIAIKKWSENDGSLLIEH